jgi:8-oxo-dGTP pyrophosphatase MutT (NUDIX family)
LLLDPAPPKYEIGWLAVAEQWRRNGVAHALMEYTLRRVLPPAEVMLITFADGVEAGLPARRFYEQHGFQPAEPGPPNPAGYATQVFRRVMGRVPTVRAVIQHNDRFLLAQHNNFLPENIGKWGLPGGRIDPLDPDRPATLRRELGEEFGLAVDIVRFIDTYPFRDRLHYVYHVQPRSNGPLTLSVDASEILDHAWLTVDEIAAWHTAGRLHTGFELAAVRASRTRRA